jgi:hypothetical protein
MKIKKSKFFKRAIKNGGKIKLHKNFTFVLFIVFIVISPWFWVLIRNFEIVFPPTFKLLTISNELLKNETNTLRGEMIKENVPNIFSKLVINKFTIYSFQISHRYFETFDPQYLFFIGDLDLKKSTQSGGPLYLAFLPLIMVGLIASLEKRTKAVLILLLLTPIPASFVITHYETISRVPIFLVLTYLAIFGLLRLFKVRKVIALLLILLLLFEFLRFSHDYFYHYPRRLSDQMSSI